MFMLFFVRYRLFFLALLLSGLLCGPAQAQSPASAPAWVLAATTTTGLVGSGGDVKAVATDAAGSIFVVGTFADTMRLGSHTLYSAGNADFFLAKYVPRTHRWAWAVRGGGGQSDAGHALAVQGGAVYITGYVFGNVANATLVTLGGPRATLQPGAADGLPSADIVVAKYLDQGDHATLAWSQVAGGTDLDYGSGIAVSGPHVYVTGCLTNTRANTQRATFGSGGPAAPARPQYGASTTRDCDLVLAKYLDHGTYATFAWSEVAGGTGRDEGNAVAVHGRSVYVAGFVTNTRADARRVIFGGSGAVAGTARQAGASATAAEDWLLAKYLDLGDHAAFGWSEVGGGTRPDIARSLAVSGRSVYVTGFVENNAADAAHVRFGGAGRAAGTRIAHGIGHQVDADLVLAKYTDHGPAATLAWLQVNGSYASADGTAVVARGNEVYVAGYFFNNRANASRAVFGGTARTPGTVPVPGVGRRVNQNLVVAGYLDHGPSATLSWVRAVDGSESGFHCALALSATRLYVAGSINPPVAFGRFRLATPAGGWLPFVAALGLAGEAAAAPAAARPALLPADTTATSRP